MSIYLFILSYTLQGECLITVATGNLGDLVAERAGLVPTHAYAVLDIRKIKVKTNRILEIDVKTE